MGGYKPRKAIIHCKMCGKNRAERFFYDKRVPVCMHCDNEDRTGETAKNYVAMLEDNVKEAIRDGGTSSYHGSNDLMYSTAKCRYIK